MKQRFNLICPVCYGDTFVSTHTIAECSCGFIGYIKDLHVDKVNDELRCLVCKELHRRFVTPPSDEVVAKGLAVFLEFLASRGQTIDDHTQTMWGSGYFQGFIDAQRTEEVSDA